VLSAGGLRLWQFFDVMEQIDGLFVVG